MQPYQITQKYGIYTARWKDITVEADSYHEAVVAIMNVIKQILWNNTEATK